MNVFILSTILVVCARHRETAEGMPVLSRFGHKGGHLWMIRQPNTCQPKKKAEYCRELLHARIQARLSLRLAIGSRGGMDGMSMV